MSLARIALAAILVGVLPASAQNQSSPQSSSIQKQAPLILLLDGLGVYVESDYIGVSSLAKPLQQRGFRTRTDSHLMSKTGDLVPDIIIGHSMGGDMALRFARKLVKAGHPAPMIITVDAAPAPPSCPVPDCTNIAGPGFAKVEGAVNINAWDSGARFTNHARLPTNPAVRDIILGKVDKWLASRPAKPKKDAVTASTPINAPSLERQSVTEKKGGGTGSTFMWSSPGWKLPEKREPESPAPSN